jgi:hypothetical protein
MEGIFDNDLTQSIIAEEPSIILPSLHAALALAQSVALVTDNVPNPHRHLPSWSNCMLVMFPSPHTHLLSRSHLILVMLPSLHGHFPSRLYWILAMLPSLHGHLSSWSNWILAMLTSPHRHLSSRSNWILARLSSLHRPLPSQQWGGLQPLLNLMMQLLLMPRLQRQNNFH